MQHENDQSQSASRFRIDDLDLDLGACELRHNGDVISLPKLSFDLLTALVRHAPNVVTIDRLIEEVWQGRIVAEETVTQRVKLLRNALTEHGYERTLVTTVRGRGYRLAAPVVRAGPDAPLRRATVAWLAAAGVGALLLAAVFAALWQFKPVGRFAASDKSIAVLPFADFTAGKQIGYVGDGIAEELLNRLARIPGLQVASRTSSFSFRGEDRDLRTIADELGVRTVVEGSVRKSGDRLRVTVQLIDAVSDKHIWSEQFDRELTDIFDVQEEVAAAVIERFHLSVPPALSSRSAKIPPAAVDLYWRARHDLRTRTATSLASAVDGLKQVIDIAPDFAPAYPALATAYIDLSRRGNFPMDEANRLAGAAIDRALKIDNRLAEAHATLGLLRMSLGDSSGAQSALRNAIELNANLADAHLWLGYSLRGQNRFDEARVLFERTLLLDPMNLGANDALAFDLMADGDYDATIRQFERRLRIEGDRAESYRLMAMTARTFGRLDAAVRWARQAVAADPDGPLNTSELVMAYAAIGELQSASTLADQAYAAAPDNHWVAALRAFTYINDGDFEALLAFTDAQLALVDPAGGAPLDQADRMRLALAGLAASITGDYVEAQRRLERALGDPVSSLLEVQFSVGLLGALAYAYEQNGESERAQATLDTALGLIDDRQDWMSRHLIYADSIAAIQLMRGDRDGAIATMREAIADGWTGHRGFLYGPAWKQLYESDDEFRSMMDTLRGRVDAMRAAVRDVDGQSELSEDVARLNSRN